MSDDRLKRRLPRWEYRVVRGGTPHDRLDLHNLERDLNELGAEGWELVKIDRAVDPQFFDGIFKRET